jgi:cell division protein ZapA (FtsZ GTPase activity inhibitor)
MAVVTIVINGKNFQIACNDGDERRLESAAFALNDKVGQLKSGSPQASTDLLLIMCALGLQDEVATLKSKLDKDVSAKDDEQVAQTLSTIAGYLEGLAKKIGA